MELASPPVLLLTWEGVSSASQEERRGLSVCLRYLRAPDYRVHFLPL